MDFPNKISQISFEQFNKLPKTGKPNKNEWTILSTIIQETQNLNKFEVVALGTGTKCIGRNKMSLKGDVLNDSHAEIICRRSFLLYIYSEIKACLNKKESIFNMNDSKFELKNKMNFHFFTTHIPCGDASIFPKNQDNFGDPLNLNEDVPIKKRKLDIYRTGAKCLKDSKEQDLHLEGDLYHKIGLIRTKPGRGDPTLSISCSDKILKWSYVGVQGALLSILLKTPIYLSTITLPGNIPFNKESLNRAFNARFSPEFNHSNYFKHNLIIYQSNEEFEFKKGDQRNQLCPSSISWNKFMIKPEVAIEGVKQGITKKKIGTKMSRLQISRIELFRNFLNVVEVINLEGFNKDLSYGEVKKKSFFYQGAWCKVKSDVFKVWVEKDEKFMNFCLD